jgi:plastocyanin
MSMVPSPFTTRRGFLGAVVALSGFASGLLGGGESAEPARETTGLEVDSDAPDDPIVCGRTAFARRRRLGAFLNEAAAFVEPPVWNSGLTDRTDQDTVEVTVGDPRAVDVTGVEMETAPVSFSPTAILVSPGTTVRWTWAADVDPAFPNDVVSLSLGCFDSGMRPPGGEDFTHTFEAWGHYLYYSTFHGAPYRVESFLGGSVYNQFGMRGAVIVTGV